MISPDQIARLAAQLGQDDDDAFAEAFAPIVAALGEDAATAIWEALVAGYSSPREALVTANEP
jgi:hypothetical protein